VASISRAPFEYLSKIFDKLSSTVGAYTQKHTTTNNGNFPHSPVLDGVPEKSPVKFLAAKLRNKYFTNEDGVLVHYNSDERN